jgi:hypothetical protein
VKKLERLLRGFFKQRWKSKNEDAEGLIIDFHGCGSFRRPLRVAGF